MLYFIVLAILLSQQDSVLESCLEPTDWFSFFDVWSLEQKRMHKSGFPFRILWILLLSWQSSSWLKIHFYGPVLYILSNKAIFPTALKRYLQQSFIYRALKKHCQHLLSFERKVQCQGVIRAASGVNAERYLVGLLDYIDNEWWK